MREREFKKEDERLIAYYPGKNGSVMMYQTIMGHIDKLDNYGFVKKNLLTLLRSTSGLCSIINENALNGQIGSAAMIDYINAEQYHGQLDTIFMGGSVAAVRSRIRKIEEISKNIAKNLVDKKIKVNVYEAGCGFIRIPLGIFDFIGEENHDLFYFIGVEKNPTVVEVASKIAESENLSDKIKVYEGDALESLRKLDGYSNLIIAEGAMEYWNLEYSIEFAREAYRHLDKGGALVGTATHIIPKRRIAEFLGTYFNPLSEEHFKNVFIEAQFSETKLIKTEPPNISIGIGTKT